MHRKRARRILGIWEKSGSRVFASEKEGWLSLARRGLATGAARGGKADGKVVIKRLCLSLPYVEKLFNSKVIKSFVKFFVFQDSYVIYMYGHYERFAYRYEYVYFTYPYHGYVTIKANPKTAFLVYFCDFLVASFIINFNTFLIAKCHRPSITDGYPYLPTPPLGQDMIQSQFLSGV